MHRSTPTRLARAALATTAAATMLLTAPGTGTSAGASPARSPAACAPATTAEGAYVRALYAEILDRCPDAAGTAHWVAELRGGSSRWAVAEAIDTSTENLGRDNVDPLFQELLGRAPTAAERGRWIDHIRRSHEDAVATASLLSSDEGYAAHTSAPTAAGRDQEWLTAAYQRILDRDPDPTGRAAYTVRLGSPSTAATRFRVAMSLEHSDANARSWVRAALAEALGRPADPSGIRYWTTWLEGRGRWQTFRLWTHQLASDEAYRHDQATG